jgi:ferritin-like metal-binding protein YciE
MKMNQLQELVLQSLEHEMGGVKVYQAAVACAQDPELKKEWQRYLAETKTHVSTLESLCKGCGSCRATGYAAQATRG